MALSLPYPQFHLFYPSTLLFSVDAPDAISVSCETGWWYNTAKHSCMRLFQDRLSRPDASAACQLAGASLAVWDNPESLEVLEGWRNTHSGRFDKILISSRASWMFCHSAQRYIVYMYMLLAIQTVDTK